jgi:hypothetical protein
LGQKVDIFVGRSVNAAIASSSKTGNAAQQTRIAGTRISHNQQVFSLTSLE